MKLMKYRLQVTMDHSRTARMQIIDGTDSIPPLEGHQEIKNNAQKPK
jgi:hypothetical protein